MKKYYIEIWNNIEENYVMQSKWFDTKEEAMRFAKQIDFLERHYYRDLMSAEFDGEEIISDIDIEESID